jgi:hypothetical protein
VGFDHSESAVALAGMAGFRLVAAVEVDGELHQLVETTATVVGWRRAACGCSRRGGGRCGCATFPPGAAGLWSCGGSAFGAVLDHGLADGLVVGVERPRSGEEVLDVVAGDSHVCHGCPFRRPAAKGQT